MRIFGIFAAVLALSACTSKDRAEIELCRAAILERAKNPSSATVPEPGSIEDLRYLRGKLIGWDRGDGLLLMNNMGAKLDTTAQCVVEGGRVAILMLDGEIVLNDERVRLSVVRQLEEDVQQAEKKMDESLNEMIRVIDEAEAEAATR